MLHVASHFLVPLLVGRLVYPTRWLRATILMVSTMAVDVDHLLAVPVYDPNRCSIDFHPLHSTPAIALYAIAFLAPLSLGRDRGSGALPRGAWVVHIFGLGLLIHMALDWGECVRLAAQASSRRAIP